MFEYQNLKKGFFFFFGIFWAHGSFLWNILKFTKKFEMILWAFDKEKWFLYQKNHLSTYKRTFESWWVFMKICSYNFESTTYFNFILFYWYIMFPWWFFKNSKNSFQGLSTHFMVLYFHAFTRLVDVTSIDLSNNNIKTNISS